MTSNTNREGEESQNRSGSSATIVCSDSARNGKTLFAKLASDLLHLRTGAVPYIFDTDNPNGSLLTHFPGCGRVIDISRTRQQVALFDGMLEQSGTHFIIDLSARHQTAFFKLMDDIDFENGAEQAGLDISIFYLIDRTPASVDVAVHLKHTFSNSRFVPVRNAAIGDAMDDWHVAEIYNNMRVEREIFLPSLSAEALGMLEHPDFHFDAFVAGQYEQLSFEMKTELWGFLESLYAQRENTVDGATHPI